MEGCRLLVAIAVRVLKLICRTVSTMTRTGYVHGFDRFFIDEISEESRRVFYLASKNSVAWNICAADETQTNLLGRSISPITITDQMRLML